MQVNRQTLILVIAIQLLLTGCASITKDSNQSVKVETYSKNNSLLSRDLLRCDARLRQS